MTDEETTDGRRLRRERGRVAVLDAMVDHLQTGRLPRSAEGVAELTGISESTLFRYFDSLADLQQQVTQRFFERHHHLFEIPDLGEGSFDARVERYVDAQVGQCEGMAPIGRVVRSLALDRPHLAATLAHLRGNAIDRVRRQFAAELAVLPPEVADDAVALIATLTGFEAWDLLTRLDRRDRAAVERLWATAIRVALSVRPDGAATAAPASP